jgi:histidinol dehydrogenase
MKIVKINVKNLKTRLSGLRRSSSLSDPVLESSTKKIVDDVKRNGDKALFKYTKRFDKLDLTKRTIKVTASEIERAESLVSKELRADLITAANRIREFHKHKLPKGCTRSCEKPS